MAAIVSSGNLRAADSTSGTVVQESWETISNRWGSVLLDKVRQTAEGGDASAQYYLAIAYSLGNGVPVDKAEAFNWMKLAAQKGMPRAQRRFGWMLHDGSGTTPSIKEAVEWLQKAAAQGDAEAQTGVGWLYEKGEGLSQDYVQAAAFYRLAAEQGHAMAQNHLGWLYKNGQGVPEDPTEAIKWFQKSAEQGLSLAKINLAWIYAAGVYGPTNTLGQGANAQIRSGGIAPDHGLAEKWMRQAVDLNSAEGQFQFGDLLHGEFDNDGHQDETRFPDAAGWYRKAAEQGYAKAQLALAEMYNYGKLGDDRRSNCIPWYLKAAAQGDAKAQAEIAELPKFYPHSELLQSINPIDTLQKSAAQDDLKSQFELARRYHEGEGVAKDPVQAFEWMEKAAQHEISPLTWTIDAHYYLGVMYEKGDGTTKDLEKAYRLYLEAAVGGNKPEPFTRVGQMFENGEGVPRDDRQAAANYYTGLKFGFSPTLHGDASRCTAIENLLNLYALGRGLPGDESVVGQQLDEIKKNHPITTAKGQFLFGKIYYEGRYATKNLPEAAAWFRLAAIENFADARQKLQLVELEIPSADKESEQSRFDFLDNRIKDAKLRNSRIESCTDCLWW